MILGYIYRNMLNRYYSRKNGIELKKYDYPICVCKDICKEHVLLNKDVEFISVSQGKIDEYTYINGAKIYDEVYIGKFCSMGYNISIGPGEHYLEHLTTFPIVNRVLNQPEEKEFKQKKKTIIGSDVWIGNNVIVCEGVHIGTGAVVGAGSVVTHDVPPYAVVVGVPAKVLKYRFSNDIIDGLLKSEWWNNDKEWFAKNKNNLLLNIDNDIQWVSMGDKL